MHPEALSGSVLEFDAAVRNGECDFLNSLGEAALAEMRQVYEQLDVGNYDALAELAERLASAAEQKLAAQSNSNILEIFAAKANAGSAEKQVPLKPSLVRTDSRALAPHFDIETIYHTELNRLPGQTKESGALESVTAEPETHIVQPKVKAISKKEPVILESKQESSSQVDDEGTTATEAEPTIINATEDIKPEKPLIKKTATSHSGVPVGLATEEINELPHYSVGPAEFAQESLVEDIAIQVLSGAPDSPAGAADTEPAAFSNIELVDPGYSQGLDLTDNSFLAAQEGAGDEVINPIMEAGPELELPVEEVGKKVIEVAELIEKLDADEAIAVHLLLDQISAKIEVATATTDARINEAQDPVEALELKEELEELFTELFTAIKAEYTEEMVRSFVHLALSGQLSDLVTVDDEETDESGAHDIGTHEIIKRLLSGVGKIKRAVVHAYYIGKSAMQLYCQQLAPAH